MRPVEGAARLLTGTGAAGDCAGPATRQPRSFKTHFPQNRGSQSPGLGAVSVTFANGLVEPPEEFTRTTHGDFPSENFGETRPGAPRSLSSIVKSPCVVRVNSSG